MFFWVVSDWLFDIGLGQLGPGVSCQWLCVALAWTLEYCPSVRSCLSLDGVLGMSGFSWGSCLDWDCTRWKVDVHAGGATNCLAGSYWMVLWLMGLVVHLEGSLGFGGELAWAPEVAFGGAEGFMLFLALMGRLVLVFCLAGFRVRFLAS